MDASRALRQQCRGAFVISSGENAIIGRDAIRNAVLPGREALREERRAILRRITPPGRLLRPVWLLARAHRRALFPSLRERHLAAAPHAEAAATVLDRRRRHARLLRARRQARLQPDGDSRRRLVALAAGADLSRGLAGGGTRRQAEGDAGGVHVLPR